MDGKPAVSIVVLGALAILTALAVLLAVPSRASADPPFVRALEQTVAGLAGNVKLLSATVQALQGEVAQLRTAQGVTASRLEQLGKLLPPLVDLAETLRLCLQIVPGAMAGLPGPHVVITGCNLHVRNGETVTDSANGLGNLILGYNEGSCTALLPLPGDFVGIADAFDLPTPCVADGECQGSRTCDLSHRTGSHNLIVGQQHRYPSFGGLVAGQGNAITGPHAAVVAGAKNTAAGRFSAVSGGGLNAASGDGASVSGGGVNHAAGLGASVSGGSSNVASGFAASVSGGARNVASGEVASVSGGFFNWASGGTTSVSGGEFNDAAGLNASISGGFQGRATGQDAAILGGENNRASGISATVSGGNGNDSGGSASAVSGGHRLSTTEAFAVLP